ncbi:AMP-binding protein, partial [Streptomyces sp. NPDC127079]|uniref:AMP-binding protein n=1 Tax=Streptomyces sp. NPDC127079 TaxID=3347132 RepID=UPI00364DD3C5
HALPEDVPFEGLNMYGPTETTVVATAGWVDPGGTGLPPIGRALPYAYTRVVTPDGALAAPGEQGELWVGGDGVATGYAHAPRQTAARFVADPHAEDGAVVYRTGDVVHLDSAGRLHYSGRRDRQFKLAGVRFELGEVEAVALRRPGVEQAVALTAGSAAGPRLHLFVTLAPGTAPDPTDEAIRAALPAQLRHLTIHHPDAHPYKGCCTVALPRLTDRSERGRNSAPTPGPTAPADPAAAPGSAGSVYPAVAPGSAGSVYPAVAPGFTASAESAATPWITASASTEPFVGGPGQSGALDLLWPALAPLSRGERLDLAHRLIGSVLGGTAAGEETR